MHILFLWAKVQKIINLWLIIRWIFHLPLRIFSAVFLFLAFLLLFDWLTLPFSFLVCQKFLFFPNQILLRWSVGSCEMKNICIFLMGIDCSKKFLNKHIVPMVLVFSHVLVFDAFYFLAHQLFPQLTLIFTLILLKWIVMVSIENFQSLYFWVCLLVLHPIRLFESIHASSHIAFIHTFIFYVLERCTGI